MNDKAEEIIKCYEKATGPTPRKQKTHINPGEVFERHNGTPVKQTEYRL